MAQPSRFWRWLAALTIVGTIALNYYANTHPFNGQTMGEVSARYPTPLTPAGYTFSIWGLIFLGLLVYAVWQLLPAQRRLALPDVVARPLLLATAGAGAWVVLFAYEQIGWSVLTMLFILVTLAAAYGRARKLVRDGAAPHWVSIPLALFLGWISVATVLSITIGLRQLTGAVDAQVETYLTYLLLVIIVGLGLLLSRVFQERTFPLVLAWALTGVWLVQVRENPDLAWVALAAGVVVLLLGLVLAQQGRKLHPYQVAQAATERAAAQAAQS
jgi:cbb3-type cytochrome oxidase subunit 3